MYPVLYWDHDSLNVTEDEIYNELKAFKFIEQGNERKISEGRDPSTLSIDYIIRGISELIPSPSGKNTTEDLNKEDTVKSLIICKKQIITFAALQDTSYTPFITQDQVNALESNTIYV